MNVACKKVNRFGRSYTPGTALSEECRSNIIDRILSEGGDRLTGYIPRSHTYFSQELKLSVNAVKSVWRRYCETMQVNPKPKGGSVWSKLKEDDLELIEVLKIHSPSMSLA